MTVARRAWTVCKWFLIGYLCLALFYAYTQNIYAPAWLNAFGDAIYDAIPGD
jgi:hypothetical protein